MSERFYCSCPITTDRVTLDGPEAHHLLHVMRANAGDAVALFDGSDAEYQAVIDSLHRSSVDLRIVGRSEVIKETPFPIAVGVALPKGDRQKWLVEKLTELGVSDLVPLVTERSVSQPTGNALERLSRTVIESSKQCGRNKLMGIAEPENFSQWVQSAIQNPKSEIPCRMLADRNGHGLSEINRTQSQPTFLAIGPEGGFTEAEIDAAVAAGWEKVSLGPRTLRTETAAVALAAAIALR